MLFGECPQISLSMFIFSQNKYNINSNMQYKTVKNEKEMTKHNNISERSLVYC